MSWKRDEIGYTGIAFPFTIAPTGSILSSTVNLGDDDTSHIVEAMEQLLGTNPGERFFNRDFGAKPIDLIFRANTAESVLLAADDIREIFDEYEPRVSITEFAMIDSDPDEGWIKIRLGLYYVQTQVANSVELTIG